MTSLLPVTTRSTGLVSKFKSISLVNDCQFDNDDDNSQNKSSVLDKGENTSGYRQRRSSKSISHESNDSDEDMMFFTAIGKTDNWKAKNSNSSPLRLTSTADAKSIMAQDDLFLGASDEESIGTLTRVMTGKSSFRGRQLK
jgi:hypothetical protein